MPADEGGGGEGRVVEYSTGEASGRQVCDQPARVCPPCSLRIAHGVCTQPITNQCQCCCVAGHAAVGPLWFGQCTRPVDLTCAHAGSCCGSAIGCAGRQVASTLSATTVRGIAVQPVAWAVQGAGIVSRSLCSLPPSLPGCCCVGSGDLTGGGWRRGAQSERQNTRSLPRRGTADGCERSCVVCGERSTAALPCSL